jgi:SSS family solute:Na+ symporter
VNGRESSSFGVSMSLVSLVFGASSVFGLAGYAYTYSLNAVWWTLSGVIFLVALRFLFVDGIMSLRAYTISDAVERVFGPNFKTVTSLLVFIPWIMVLAGQIIAGGTIISLITGDRTSAFIIFCLIFFSYTVITGQSGTVRTSFLQNLIMIAGVVILFAYAVHAYGSLPPQRQQAVFRFGFSDGFSPMFLLNVALPVGLSYLFGPDIYSRIFTARDASSAKRGILIASAVILAVSLMIVAIGILGGQILGGTKTPDEIVPRLASLGFHGIAKTAVLVALVSIPLSGADAMLANMGTLLGKDITGGLYSAATGKKIDERHSVVLVRAAIIVTAGLSVFAALHSREIIPTLLVAYRVFSVVAVPLIMASMLSIKYGVIWKSGRMKGLMAAYMGLTAAAVFLLEFKIVSPAVRYPNLYLLIVNILVFAAAFAVTAKKDSLRRD